MKSTFFARLQKLGLGLTVALSGVQLGCAPSAEVKGPPPLSENSLPTEPEALLKIADEQFDSGPTGFRNAQVAAARALQKNPEWASSKASFGAQWRLARAAAELCTADDGAPCTAALPAGLAAGKRA